jgi:hypothetical protein
MRMAVDQAFCAAVGHGRRGRGRERQPGRVATESWRVTRTGWIARTGMITSDTSRCAVVRQGS